MPNLRDRLRRIQEQKTVKTYENTVSKNNLEGWETCGFNVLKRVVTVPSVLYKIKKLPDALPVIIPDLKKIPDIGDFVFFDLETSGLSMGAGTVAFLAAFGRITGKQLSIKQYLLLDYSGQNDFLENVIGEFKYKKDVIVSYNGKCFDAQIIKTMCLMNRIKPPEYNHADLLYPARRLWKSIIQDCSQGSIERNILGIHRNNDIPGVLAPDIWFDFLKTGRTERLIGICNHNCYDISGLSSILDKMISIANDPFDSKHKYDIERLALYCRKYLSYSEDLSIIKNELLRHAAVKGYSQAVYIYSYEQMRNRNYREALKFVNKGLKLYDEESRQYLVLFRRKERLEKIIAKC
ncbi:MAG: ribonuclease H-like domain-containing protein [Treponema sp.]|nr:ribonuclease H-like domain-containing protein [Treponema sp.]